MELNDYRIAGLPVGNWIDLFYSSHNVSGEGIKRIDWPNGGSYHDQENILILIFSAIREEIIMILKSSK